MEADDQEISFNFSLAGRIRNISLPPTNTNALIPLFESISNSIHSIESRYGSENIAQGTVEIEICRTNTAESHVTGFVISDNGEGLNESNWNSFRTSDSEHKIKRGGKGVGRLSWLKAFEITKVESTFHNLDGQLYYRKFSFGLGKDGGFKSPILEHSLKEIDGNPEVKTTVELTNYYPGFESQCPKKSSTIAAKIVGHFLPYLVTGNFPTVTLHDIDEIINIGEFYRSHQIKSQTVNIASELPFLDEEDSYKIHHLLLRKQIRLPESGLHWMFYAAHDRVVMEQKIDAQLGLKYIGEESDGVYIGLVTGSYLDSHVNQERTGFSYGDEDASAVHKTAIESAKLFLSDHIEKIRQSQEETCLKIIQKNPQFLAFRSEVRDFVISNLPLNTQSEEDIFLELSRRRMRSKRRTISELSSLKKGTAEHIGENVQKITKALNDDKKGSLAEYVVRRKEILDLLEIYLSHDDNRKYFKEEAVHGLICPVQSSSESLNYEDHNLWIIDDRLAFYTFFQSDRPFRTFLEDTTSGKEPDLAIMFDRALAFQRENRNEPIVIVEFKRPGRNDYDNNTSPVSQILEYVDKFRSSTSVVRYDGRHVRSIDSSTRFICYVIADFTSSLIRVLNVSIANNPSADGEGYYGYSSRHNAFIEVVPYAKVLNDAKIRNEVFFSQLDLV